MASILIIGIMLVIAQWGQVIGWGTNDLTKLQPSAELPALVIAHRIWGSLWWLTLLAMVTSVLGVTPRLPERRDPHVVQHGPRRRPAGDVRPGSPHAQDADSGRLRRSWSCRSAWASWVPGSMGTWAFFIFLVGYTLVLAVIFVYIAANIGLVKHFMTKARGEFNFILHFIFPVGHEPRSSLLHLRGLLAASGGSEQLYAAGRGRLAWSSASRSFSVMKARGREDWLTKAAEVIAEREATASEKPML